MTDQTTAQDLLSTTVTILKKAGWASWIDERGEWWAPPEEQPDHVGRFGMRLHEALEIVIEDLELQVKFAKGYFKQ